MLFSSPIPCSAEEHLLEVIRGTWAKGINNERQPAQEVTDTVSDISKLYFWTQIEGSERALNILSSKGKLPIRHKWYTYYGVTLETDGSQEPIDEINLSVGKIDKLKILRSEVNGKGSFNWRTWSMKKNIRSGIWLVKIVYADGKPVYCEELDGPCEYTIKVE
jgi:hypothetical protein